MLSGIRIERSERGMPGEFDWLEKLSVDELRLLADGKLDIASYRKDGDAADFLFLVFVSVFVLVVLLTGRRLCGKLFAAFDRALRVGGLIAHVESAVQVGVGGQLAR